MWCHQESNRGHKDFQSFALPTELWHQNMFLQEGNVVVFPFLRCKGREFSDTVQIFGNFFSIFSKKVENRAFLAFLRVFLEGAGRLWLLLTFSGADCFLMVIFIFCSYCTVISIFAHKRVSNYSKKIFPMDTSAAKTNGCLR